MYVVLTITLIINGIYGKQDTFDCGNGNKPTKPKCGKNEVATNCKIVCPPQSCESIYSSYACDKSPCEPGCNCKDGYLRDVNNTCIPSEQCSSAPTEPTEPECGPNEVATNCKIVCPPQSCESIYSSYACDKSPCEPGCNCKDGYLRDANNTCISSEQCSSAPTEPTEPECGPNEVATNCKIVCPPQSCESIYSSYACDKSPCEPGCNCKDGYLRDANNTCIPSEQCSSAPTEPTEPECGPNEVATNCKIVCPPQSCESIYSSYACDKSPCEPGCNCKDGYLRDANNTCIPSEQCSSASSHPQCGPNEVASDCKITCPPQSCTSLYTKFACLEKPCESGCNCKDGYLRDQNNTCIPSNKCPGVSNTICGVNETFVDCAFRCPNQNCPADDSLIKVACKPGQPCPSGCACKDGYKRKNDDDSCVLASDCPPVCCTRPNEIWNSCSSDCLSERCEDDDNQQSGCETSGDCQPRCVCRKNFCRDENNICKPSKSHISEPTCAEPNPSNFLSQSKNKSIKAKRTCQDGYILSGKGGKCIKIEDCPKGCNGDPNAVAKACPSACTSTCSKPNALPCSKECKPLGCECAFGYLRSDVNGKCITPQECPGGNPCKSNEKFVNCKNSCPTDYCPKDDSRAIVICEPLPIAYCSAGCVCNLNHKRLSKKNDTCIVSSECPPVNCTRPNEEWNPCPSECQSEYCESANSEPVTCNTLLLNCQPRCTCKKNYFRNSDNICIPAKCCPKS